MDIGLAGAFVGGILTLLSPCSVMLLPAFFSYAFASPSTLLARTGLFYLGLITTLVPLGVLAGTLGAFVSANRTLIVSIASVLVILLGVIMMLGINVPVLRGRGTTDQDATSGLAVYALGTVYGLAGVCAGPLLGAVLTLAGLGGDALYGGVVLLVFAAGMTVPLLILSLLWGRVPGVKALVRPRELRLGRIRTTWSGFIGGILTVAVGVLLLVTGGTASLAGFLGASDQLALEASASRFTAGIPDAVVLGIVVVIAGGAWAGTAWVRRKRQAQQPAASS